MKEYFYQAYLIYWGNNFEYKIGDKNGQFFFLKYYFLSTIFNNLKLEILLKQIPSMIFLGMWGFIWMENHISKIVIKLKWWRSFEEILSLKNKTLENVKDTPKNYLG